MLNREKSISLGGFFVVLFLWLLYSRVASFGGCEKLGALNVIEGPSNLRYFD